MQPSTSGSHAIRRAMEAQYTSLDGVAFPVEDWEAGVKRIHINFCGKPHALSLPLPGDLRDGPDESREDDERVEVEGDEDWMDEKDLEGLKGIIATYQPDFDERKASALWGRLDGAIGKGKKVKIAWPVVLLLATRR